MDTGAYAQFIIALLFVLGLILLAALAARKFGLIARVTTGSLKTRDKRLDIVEILPIDARRKLILIRRDDVEHLLLLGEGRGVVVEKAIAPPIPESHPYPESRPAL